MARRSERSLDEPRFALAALFACLATGACLPVPGTYDTASGAGDSNDFLNHDSAVRYLGRDACQECHEGNFVNFARTGMGRSFYPMRTDNIVEDFTDNNERYTRALDFYRQAATRAVAVSAPLSQVAAPVKG